VKKQNGIFLNNRENAMASIKHIYEQLKFYLYLLNPAIPKKYRICRSFSRGAHSQYDFLDKSQWWSSAELENYQNEKLARLIRHAYENVPYYSKLFKENGLRPDDVQTTSDLAKIPILTKKTIRENFPFEINRGAAGVFCR
jgi:phenylacetate-CoA ligase